jgi:hypothetical protein
MEARGGGIKMVHVRLFACLFFAAGTAACHAQNASIDPRGTTVEKRFIAPQGYVRISVEEGGFQEYLRMLPLKPYGEKVRYYDGSIKTKDVYVSVVDMDVGTRDLLQCADAVMKLRAEYFYARKSYDRIQFHITNGALVSFERWAQGYRPKVSGNSVTWAKTGVRGHGRAVFDEYLAFVYSWAGTLSLSAELKKKEEKDLGIGDVFITGGSPGHVVIVVDLAVSEKTGEKIFLLAQSYMPAQEIQILKSGHPISPWYEVPAGELLTPEWRFEAGSLKTF